ncbi:MAG: type II toxin-antitoxin system RelE/ParE family toxin [Gammaproteobacteria bacterium]|nr:type II toxin-antitoxin system RelE/ParE family toxin [Gammaproteobacteria bacterium]MBU1654396.1 type II toxin-antitoxin system RelE/ParE family toxin [Gammaproteobacteria bacterium]MBU1960237.1 type II toxin-antitoxin system RelE/ParE family toxin [Gammaproteobacteria bacterium]
MRFDIHLRQEAEWDLEEDSTWYEEQRKGLGHEFLDAVLAKLDAVSENPKMFPLVHKDMRRAVINRFPFGIYYRIETETIIVFAVMHGSRHPHHWQQRT